MGRLLERIRIGIVGLGWVGQEVARAALEDPRVRLVGVADVDPAKAGRDLGEIIGEGRLGVPIDSSVEVMLNRARPEVAVLCTTSDVEKLGPALEACVAHGAHVVTTCENLADPDLALTQLEPGFEQRVRESNLVVLATGVNPGFAMDRLPVMLTQATRNIRRVRVVRVVNASTRRAQLQAKIGVGMTPHEFSDAIQRGDVGHAGLSASLRLLAKGLGITLEKTSEAFTPVIAEQDTSSSVLGLVKAGSVRGIYQIARGYRGRREVITLELTMALDEPHPRDTIDIVGEPPLHFEGELPGDTCTVATVLSAISVIVTMPAGMRTVLDVPLEQPEEPSPPREPAIVARPRAQTDLPRPSRLEPPSPPAPAPEVRIAATTIDAIAPRELIQKGKRARKAGRSAGATTSNGAAGAAVSAPAAPLVAAKVASDGAPATGRRPRKKAAAKTKTPGTSARTQNGAPPEAPAPDAAREAPTRRSDAQRAKGPAARAPKPPKSAEAPPKATRLAGEKPRATPKRAAPARGKATAKKPKRETRSKKSSVSTP